MSTYEWVSLLQQWNEDILNSSDAAYLPEEVLRTGWLGFPPATEEEIQAAEARLGVRLPDSYREFLKVTNGWRMTSPFIDRVWGTEEIEWLAMQRRYILDPIRRYGDEEIPDSEYFLYGEWRPGPLRLEDLERSLEVGFGSDVDQYLLLPAVTTEEGECDAFAVYPKGGEVRVRYRSFWDLMVGEYELFLRLRDVGG